MPETFAHGCRMPLPAAPFTANCGCFRLCCSGAVVRILRGRASLLALGCRWSCCLTVDLASTPLLRPSGSLGLGPFCYLVILIRRVSCLRGNQLPCVITRPFARWEGGCCLHLAEETKDVSQLLVPLADYDQGKADWSVAAEGCILSSRSWRTHIHAAVAGGCLSMQP
jgi:hypothetical protein